MSDQMFSPPLDFLTYSSGCKSEWAVLPYAGTISRSIKRNLGLSMHLLSSRVT